MSSLSFMSSLSLHISFGKLNSAVRHRCTPSFLFCLDQTILDTLEKQRFAFFQELAQLTRVRTTIAHQYLMHSLGFMVRHLHWVPHGLTATQEPSVPLYQTSYCASSVLADITDGRVITLGELQFSLSAAHEHIWFCP
jgi:hypothetical protein